MTEAEPIVFVVDDAPSIREALTSLIRSVGLRVETFGSAREFLTRQRPDAPGCLVLDVRLPGLSGLDLQRELSAAQVNTPIIFITGHGDIPITVRAMKAGAVEFLTKPFRDQACSMPSSRPLIANARPGNSARNWPRCASAMRR
jgi:FixJ family two-component response regulator